MSVSINNSFLQQNSGYNKMSAGQSALNIRVGANEVSKADKASELRNVEPKEALVREVKKALPGLEYEVSRPAGAIKNTYLASAAGKLKSSASALSDDSTLFAKKADTKKKDDAANSIVKKDGAANIAVNKNDIASRTANSKEAAVYSGVVTKMASKEKSADATMQNDYTNAFESSERGRIGKKVNDFVRSYNDMLDAALESDNTRVLKNTLSMTQVTAANEDYLAKVGVNLEDDNKLSVDDEKLSRADMSDLKSLFSGGGSYTDTVNYLATQAIENAGWEASGKAYNAAGNYANPLLTGSIYDIKL